MWWANGATVLNKPSPSRLWPVRFPYFLRFTKKIWPLRKISSFIGKSQTVSDYFRCICRGSNPVGHLEIFFFFFTKNNSSVKFNWRSRTATELVFSFHCSTGLKDSLSYENRRNSLDLEQNNRWWWCKNKCINWSAGHCSLTFEFELVKKVTKISVVSNLRSSSVHLLLWITNFFLVLLQEH